MAEAAQFFFPEVANSRPREAAQAGSGNIHPDVVLGKNVILEPNVVIRAGVEVGDGSYIGSNAHIGHGVVMGRIARWCQCHCFLCAARGSSDCA